MSISNLSDIEMSKSPSSKNSKNEAARKTQELLTKFGIGFGVVSALMLTLQIVVVARSGGSSNVKKALEEGGASAAVQGALSTAGFPLEPPLPGVMPGKDRPHLILAQDIDYPPYAYLASPPEGDYRVAGFGHDVAMGLKSVCDIDITVVQSGWASCWDSGAIGKGLLRGEAHACMTYTHTTGERNRFVEFSHGILQMNKPAGLIVRMNNSVPEIDGNSNLNGKKIVDVIGWAPTSDGLSFVKNTCANSKFEGFEMMQPTVDTGNANDNALMTLLNGDADAIWIYADQAYQYQCSDEVASGWDCATWGGLGDTFAYIHTGLYGHAYNGTTLTLARKGSGIKDIVDPCIEKYMQTESYYKDCTAHHLESSCYSNTFFPPANEGVKPPYKKHTNELTTSCADGYCPCPS